MRFIRKKRINADHLVRCDSYICHALAKTLHVIAIFHPEKAYDTTWKHGVLCDLHDLDFQGHRLFKLRTRPTLSDTYQQEMVFPRAASYLRFYLVLKSIRL